MDTTQPTEQVDPTALALSRSIRKVEGGNYDDYSGDAGTSAGAYQWNNGKLPLKKGEVPANFKSSALRYKLDPNDFSQANQDHVAYAEIKGDLDSGLSQSQIAAKWNSGLTHGWENHKGTTTINGKTISYDTPSYVAKVQKEYENQMNGGSAPGSSTPKTFSDSVSNIPQPMDRHSGALGTDPTDSLYGKLIDNSVTRGIMNVGNALSFGGAKQLGGEVGKGLADITENTKGLLSGKNNSQFVDQPSLGNTVAGAGKTIAGVGLLAGGGILSDLMKTKTALQAPEVVNALNNTLGKGETIANLTRQDAINALGNTLKEMPTSEVGGKTEQAILKALKELNPTLIEKQNLLAKLVKGGWNLAKGGILLKLFGDTVGGFIHQNTK